MSKKRKLMNCPICKQEIIPEYSDAYSAYKERHKNTEPSGDLDVSSYVKNLLDRPFGFEYKCPKCNEEFEIPPEMAEIQCPECKKIIKPQYTDHYLKERREHKLKGISLENDELQCPECNTIFHFAVEFVPWTGPKSGLERNWEKTRGWFRKFLP